MVSDPNISAHTQSPQFQPELPQKRTGRTKGLLQAYEVQDIAMAALRAFRDTHQKDGKLICGRDDAQTLINLVKSWETAQDRIRIHRGKPLPGALRPEKKQKLPKTELITMPEPLSDLPQTGT